MGNLKQLVAPVEYSKQLLALGVTVESILWHIGGDIRTFPVGVEDNHECICLPAFTKEELDVMLGDIIDKPDTQEMKNVSQGEISLNTPNIYHGMREEDRRAAAKAMREYVPAYWVVYLPEKCVNFNSGAEASAFFLIEGIKRNKIKPEDAVRRYNQFYNKK